MAAVYGMLAYEATVRYAISHVVLCGAVAILFLLVSMHYLTEIRFPPEIPRVREKGRSRFSFRTRLAYFTDCESLFREAYETVSTVLFEHNTKKSAYRC